MSNIHIIVNFIHHRDGRKENRNEKREIKRQTGQDKKQHSIVKPLMANFH